MVARSELSAAELRVWEAFPRGDMVRLGGEARDPDEASGGDGWGPSRQVRAEVIIELLGGAFSPVAGRVAALRLSGARIVGRLALRDAEIRQSVQLRGCRLDDGLDLSEARTRSLDLTRCHIRGLSLNGAHIEGNVGLVGAHLADTSGYALDADGLTLSRDLFCRDGFRSQGEIRLVGASIGGQFELGGAHLANPGGKALSAERMTLAGHLICRDGFEAQGEVCLVGASIGGALDLNGAHLNDPGGSPLNADGLHLGGSLFCRDGFQAQGEVRLLGARIAGQLNLAGAHLANPDGYAFNADRMTVAGTMFCDNGFRAEGEMRMLGVRIGGRLRFDGADLANPGGNVLTADQMVVTEGVYCQDGFQAEGGISLYRTNIGVLCDDPGSWPRRLVLDGFTYEGLYPYLPAGRRLKWLRRMDDYRAQPYEQLAAYYRRLGHDEQARRVLLAQLRARTNERPWWARSWGWFQDVLAGYGYAPGRAVGWLVGVLIVGWVYFHLHQPAPAEPQEHPVFHAGLYALDLMLPAPSLGQEQAWDPQGGVLAIATTLRIFGWLLAIAVVASITRALSRN
jgi:hypothetical protein